jgi:hypothetical protein
MRALKPEPKITQMVSGGIGIRLNVS